MASEPGIPKILSNCSFFNMPTPAMRSAPEELFTELNRRIFYEVKKDSQYRQLVPRSSTNKLDWKKEEIFLLDAFKGRKKLGGDRVPYYSSAYPWLARNGWFRTKDPITVNGFLFSGPVSHYFKASNLSSGKFCDRVVTSLLDETDKEDIFKQALKPIIEENPNMIFSYSKASKGLSDYLEKSLGETQTLSKNTCDVFSRISTEDLILLLFLQSKLPRHHWVLLLQGFLRTTTSMWAIGQIRGTELILDWTMDAFKGKVLTQEEIEIKLSNRHKGIFHPSSRMVGNIVERLVEGYGKSRVMISSILGDLKELGLISEEEFNGKFTAQASGGKSELSIRDYLLRLVPNVHKVEEYGRKKLPDLDLDLKNPVETIFARQAEKWPMYTNPNGSAGQTKNLKEFLKVLEKSEGHDDSASHILEQIKRGSKRSLFKVYPGQLLIQMMVMFADSKKKMKPNYKGESLNLIDLEDHLKNYGIDFTTSVDGRTLLMEILSNGGLLSGSPDAGDGVEVINPYKHILKGTKDRVKEFLNG